MTMAMVDMLGVCKLLSEGGASEGREWEQGGVGSV
jgi:hypothetical protein